MNITTQILIIIIIISHQIWLTVITAEVSVLASMVKHPHEQQTGKKL